MNKYIYLDLDYAKKHPDEVFVANAEGENVVYNLWTVADDKEGAIRTIMEYYGKPPLYGVFLKNNNISRELSQKERSILFR